MKSAATTMSLHLRALTSTAAAGTASLPDTTSKGVRPESGQTITTTTPAETITTTLITVTVVIIRLTTVTVTLETTTTSAMSLGTDTDTIAERTTEAQPRLGSQTLAAAAGEKLHPVATKGTKIFLLLLLNISAAVVVTASPTTAAAISDRPSQTTSPPSRKSLRESPSDTSIRVTGPAIRLWWSGLPNSDTTRA